MRQNPAEKMTELLARVEDHPLIRQFLAEKAVAVLATRTEAAEKIEALKKEWDEVIPKLQADLNAKEEKFKEAKAIMEAFGREFQAAKAELYGENSQFDHEINQLKTVLFETADPAIDEAIIFFQDKLDDLRKPGRISSRGMETTRNLFTERDEIKTETNLDAVTGAMRYCMAAIKRLKELKLSPEFHIEVIQKFKDGIPSIEVYREVTREKPSPGSKGVSPLQLLKSDSQLDWELGKIDEKFKKLMRRR